MPKYKITKKSVPVRATDEIHFDFEDPFQLFLKNIAKEINVKKLLPVKILKSGNATIVFWNDGKVTAVRRSPDEPDNEYFAFTAALAKRIFQNNSNIKRILRTKTEWKEDEKTDD